MEQGTGKEEKPIHSKVLYNSIVTLGKILYRYRAAIAVLFFLLLVLSGQTPRYGFIPYVIVLLGLAVRFWAAGYVGKAARAASFKTTYRVVNGPYKYLKHPLYMGNFFLVIGVIFLFNPPFPHTFLFIAFFLIEYAIIAVSEMHYVHTLTKKTSHFSIGRALSEVSTFLVVFIILLIHLLMWKMVDMPVLLYVK